MFVSLLRIFAALFVAAAVGVSAQDVSPCVTTCVMNAEPAGGCTGLYMLLSHRLWTSIPHALFLSSTDITCMCNSQAFQSAATACIQAKCTPAEQQSAKQLQQKQCS